MLSQVTLSQLILHIIIYWQAGEVCYKILLPIDLFMEFPNTPFLSESEFESESE